jgi:hypothetical protein
MTVKQLVWLAVIGTVAAAGLVALHLVLPTDATWSANRGLNYAWEGVVALAAVGGVVWVWWPRPKAARRDIGRLQARRRLYATIVVIMVAALIAIFGEMRRDVLTRRCLESSATAPLQAIAQAVGRYAEAGNKAAPESLEALVQGGYLDGSVLLYEFRSGPFTAKAEGAAGEGSEAPSFALAREMVTAKTPGDVKPRFLAYLRPGHAWAPLTIAIGRDNRVEIVSEDVVSRYEWQFESRR